MYSSLCCPPCDSFPRAPLPFIGCNLLLSCWVYIKDVLQATIFEKNCAASLCCPVAHGQSPSSGASKVEVSWGDSSQIRKGSVFGVLETPKRFSSQGPVVKTAVRGVPEDKRWRARGEEAHFWLKGVLSPPIISHCPVES